MNGLTGKIIVAAAAAISLAALASRKPWQDLRYVQANIAEAKKDVSRAETQKADLVELNSRYSRGAGWEELARDKGFYKAGERPLRELVPNSSK